MDLRSDEALGNAVVEPIRNGDLGPLKRLIDVNCELATARIDRPRTLLHVVTDWPGHLDRDRAPLPVRSPQPASSLARPPIRTSVTAIVLGVLVSAGAARPQATHEQFAQDFRYLCEQVASTYAYFDLKATRWADVPQSYAPDLARVRNKKEFIRLLENVLDELYDAHTQLTVNTPESPRLVPSGTDLWAEWHRAEAVIVEVRSASDAERAGIRPGAIVLTINGITANQAMEKRMGRTYPHSAPAARDWALRAVLAGTHNTARTLQIRDRNGTRTVILAGRDQFGGAPDPPLTSSEVRPGIGYVRFNDSLGENATVTAFDRAIEQLRGSRALIIDLRNTPGGGNTSVARGILGRFVDRELPYQKHSLPSEEQETGIRRSWLELVSPRGPFVFEKPVAILVDHWTGSMGEGLAIGFDATGRGTVVGTPMAGLLGATYHVQLPNTGIGVNVPAERLYHVKGTPRESFQPAVPVDVGVSKTGEDSFITAALRVLRN